MRLLREMVTKFRISDCHELAIVAFQLLVVALLSAIGCDDQRGHVIIESREVIPDVDTGERNFALRTCHDADVCLGILQPGESTTMRVWLVNSSSATICPATYSSSCQCVSVKLPDEVPPASRKILDIRFDGEDDPDFVGGLLVNLVLKDETGSIVAKLHISVDVVASKQEANDTDGRGIVESCVLE